MARLLWFPVFFWPISSFVYKSQYTSREAKVVCVLQISGIFEPFPKKHTQTILDPMFHGVPGMLTRYDDGGGTKSERFMIGDDEG